MTLVPVLVSLSLKERQQLAQSCCSYQCQWDAHNTVPQWNYQRGPRVSWQRWDLVWPDWVSILWCCASASRERGRKWDPSYFHLISNEIAGEISPPLPPSPGYFSRTSVWCELPCKSISADVYQTMHVAKRLRVEPQPSLEIHACSVEFNFNVGCFGRRSRPLRPP